MLSEKKNKLTYLLSITEHAMKNSSYNLKKLLTDLKDVDGVILYSLFQLPIEEEENNTQSLKVLLKYKGWWIKKPLFSIIKRISKPGLRVFSGYKQFNNKLDVLRYEQGIAIISTSSGVMSHIKASKLKKGGEIICYIG